MDLRLENINKSFFYKNQEAKILQNINFNLKSGEITALIGPSGSGKTTLLQIAGLLDSTTSGKIFFDDIDLTNAKDAERTKFRRDNIGFIYQDHNLLPEFTSIENIMMPLLICGINKNIAIDEANKLLKKIDLTNRRDYFPHELSGGQKQRISIARAIISKPKILFADEPTGNLDSNNAKNIFNIFYDLTKEYNINSLIVTHNIELANKLDKIITIEDGELKY